jgi:hypothetical protein
LSLVASWLLFYLLGGKRISDDVNPALAEFRFQERDGTLLIGAWCARIISPLADGTSGLACGVRQA